MFQIQISKYRRAGNLFLLSIISSSQKILEARKTKKWMFLVQVIIMFIHIANLKYANLTILETKRSQLPNEIIKMSIRGFTHLNRLKTWHLHTSWKWSFIQMLRRCNTVQVHLDWILSKFWNSPSSVLIVARNSTTRTLTTSSSAKMRNYGYVNLEMKIATLCGMRRSIMNSDKIKQ